MSRWPDVDRARARSTRGTTARPCPTSALPTPDRRCLCHGIPDARPLRVGDIVNIDVTVYREGFHGDCSDMFVVCAGSDSDSGSGEASTSSSSSSSAPSPAVSPRPPGWRRNHPGASSGGVPPDLLARCPGVSPDAVALTRWNRLAVMAAVERCGPDVPFTVVADAVADVLAEAKACGDGWVRLNADFVGHGVGRVFHASPAVHPSKGAYGPLPPGWDKGGGKGGGLGGLLAGLAGGPPRMRLGQTFTIEPIFVSGSPRFDLWKDDGWTVTARDGGWAAQHEHTVLITATGAEVLTLPSDGGEAGGIGPGGRPADE